jgi:hypothetical protein
MNSASVDGLFYASVQFWHFCVYSSLHEIFMEKLEFTALKQKKAVDVDNVVNYLQPIRRGNI